MNENDMALAKKLSNAIVPLITGPSRSNVNVDIMLIDMLIKYNVISASQVKEFLEQKIESLQTIDVSTFEDGDKFELDITLNVIKRIYDELFK